MVTKLLARRHQHARHGQQLRQRQHAVGHLPHLRGELGRLLPPRRRRPTTRSAPRRSVDLAHPLRRAPARGRELWATADADRSPTTQLRALERRARSAPRADGSDDFRNVANTYGWVVEIDPFDPTSHAKKRTALGPLRARRRVARRRSCRQAAGLYMGDDSRSEYIYKFVSTANWDPADADRAASPPATSTSTPASSTSRKFNADGTGDVARAGARQQRHHRR